MIPLYLDTNIFIYLSQKKSPFYSSASALIHFLKRKCWPFFTSTETVQEIIYYSQNIKELLSGIKVATAAMRLVDEVLPVNRETINLYLDLVKIYRSRISRDSLHVAVCRQNNIRTFITHDADFKKFKEIQSITPEEFLSK